MYTFSFYEFEVSQDEEFLTKIEEVLELMKLNLSSRNPDVWLEYIQFKRVYARLTILVYGDVDQGLNDLLEAQQQVTSLNTVHLEHVISHEIEKLESKYSKWTGISNKLQNKITMGNIATYIQNAQKIKLSVDV